ncbi:MAG: 30S ribosomal protein S24e [Crenarchaeota archaeon]|nr:30S ribosomal protein S24e [Thermoproteota archaeon]
MEFEVTIVDRRWNPLAEREELDLILTHVAKPTPTRCEVKEKLANMLNVDKKLLVVTKMLTEYGIGRTRARAHVYRDYQRLLKLEPEKVKKLNEQCEQAQEAQAEA